MPVDPYPMGLMLRTAGFAAAVSAITGMWLAWVLVNCQFPGSRSLKGALYAAIALPAPVLSYYLLSTLAHLWPLTRAGLYSAGIVAGLPLMVRAARTALGTLDPIYSKAAHSLRAGGWTTFTRVEFPLIAKPIGAAVLLVFGRVAAELAVGLWLVRP
jgi:ABC-type Fe3+ transport system permease subunit